jgi:hypothetical protein
VRYQRVVWHHDHPDEPIVLYAEVDDDGWERRKVDEYRDGRLDRADASGGSRNKRAASQVVSDLSLGRLPGMHDSSVHAGARAVFDRVPAAAASPER